MIELRNYQHNAIENLRASIGNRGHKRVLLQAATGAGKTVIACEMIRRATMKNKSVLFIAHRKEIINQTSHKLDAFGIAHGVIMASHQRKNNHAVQVASIQTLTRRNKPPADLVIIDETHLACGASFRQILEHYKDSTVIGLTATPVRLDGKGLGEIYSDIIEVVPMAQLIEEGHLVKPRVFAPFAPDMKGVRKSKGDYDATETANLMDRKEVTANIVNHWNESAKDRKTIVFASSVEHSKNITAEFEEMGISAKHLDANTPAIERDRTLQAWREGEFMVLSNCGLFIEGLDVPAASCCILARPTKSLTIYLQAVGRVMRPHESKNDCIILDCAGLTYEHGFVDDHREWSLQGKVKKQREDVKAVHTCENCFAAYSKAQYLEECPECGFKTPVEQREVNNADVDMVELTPAIVAELRKKQRKQDFISCKTLSDYLEMARRYNYKQSWAYIQYNNRKKWLESHGYQVPAEAVAI